MEESPQPRPAGVSLSAERDEFRAVARAFGPDGQPEGGTPAPARVRTHSDGPTTGGDLWDVMDKAAANCPPGSLPGPSIPPPTWPRNRRWAGAHNKHGAGKGNRLWMGQATPPPSVTHPQRPIHHVNPTPNKPSGPPFCPPSGRRPNILGRLALGPDDHGRPVLVATCPRTRRRGRRGRGGGFSNGWFERDGLAWHGGVGQAGRAGEPWSLPVRGGPSIVAPPRAMKVSGIGLGMPLGRIWELHHALQFRIGATHEQQIGRGSFRFRTPASGLQGPGGPFGPLPITAWGPVDTDLRRFEIQIDDTGAPDGA